MWPFNRLRWTRLNAHTYRATRKGYSAIVIAIGPGWTYSIVKHSIPAQAIVMSSFIFADQDTCRKFAGKVLRSI